MSLRNKTVVVTRRPDQAEEFVSLVAEKGGRTVVIPMIDIGPPPSWEACDAALGRLESYDAIAFTSANAVHAFVARCRQQAVDRSLLERCPLYAVGPQTGRALEEEGYSMRALPGNYSAMGLARHLSDLGMRGKHILLPRGDVAFEDLPRALAQAGADVHSVTVYATHPPPAARARELSDLLAAGGCDAIAFASPSAVHHCAALLAPMTLAEVRRRAAIAVIGPTTARAVREEGTEPDIVSPESTGRGLVDAIERYYSEQPA